MPPAPDPAPTVANPRSEQRRQELLDAAERVVMRDGPDASMNAIAAEAGVTKPILYRHFGDKQGLYQVLAERHIQTLLAQARAALSGPGDWRARTEAAIDVYLALIEDSPQLYRFLMHRAAVDSPEIASQVAVFLRRLGDELGEGISREAGAGCPDGAPNLPMFAAWGHGIVGMIHAAGDWWLDRRLVPRADLVRQLTDLLWGALPSAGARHVAAHVAHASAGVPSDHGWRQG